MNRGEEIQSKLNFYIFWFTSPLFVVTFILYVSAQSLMLNVLSIQANTHVAVTSINASHQSSNVTISKIPIMPWTMAQPEANGYIVKNEAKEEEKKEMKIETKEDEKKED